MNSAAKDKARDLKPFLVDYLQKIGLKRTSASLYNCPLCGSGTGRNHSGAFNVYQSGTRWHCHSCGKGGDLIDLIAALENISWGKALSVAGEMYLSGTKSDITARIAQRTITPVRSCIASVEKRNAFYMQLLGYLTLNTSHRDDLLRRGLPESNLWQYRSVPQNIYSNTTKEWLVAVTFAIITQLGDVPEGVPGFYVNQNGEWTVTFPCQGYLIPVKDLAGRIQGLQVRADVIKKDRKYCWVSSNPDPAKKHPFIKGTCAETAPHCHFASAPTDTLYITEGPLKGEIAGTLLDRTFVAIPGTTCLSTLTNVLAAFKKRGYTRVVCAMDMDRFTNVNVSNAIEKIKGIVESAGMEWHDYVWNPNFANNKQYKGIDDWALARSLARTLHR